MTVVIYFKTAAGAVAKVNRQIFKIVYFSDTTRSRIEVDLDAIAIGKQPPSKHGRKVLLIYKSHVYIEA